MFIGRISFVCAGSKRTLYKLGNTTEVISGACRGLRVFRRYRKWDCQTLLAGILATVPWKSAELDTCMLGDAGQLAAAPLQLPSCTGDFTSMPHKGTDTEQQKEAQVLFGLYHMIFPWGCISRWNQPGFSQGCLSKKKNLQVFFKQHPSVAFMRGQFSQVFEDERATVSSLRNPAGMQPEETDTLFFPMPELQAQ